MKIDHISTKVIAIGLIGGACFVASLLVLGLSGERQNRADEAKEEIAAGWSQRQIVVGPMVIVDVPIEPLTTEDGILYAADTRPHILPETLQYETVLEPEVRSRGIFESIVYTSQINVSGEFSADALRQTARGRDVIFSVAITDTRGIEKQLNLSWNGREYAFDPGSGTAASDTSGLHARVPIPAGAATIPFSFSLQLRGSEGVSIAPLGKETTLSITSPWITPKFVGAFLPTEREIGDSGFSARWRISSFGRSYPQSWEGGTVDFDQLMQSSAGVDLLPEINAYDMVFRSVKYAVLFIVITFAAFFLFDVLAGIRIHPIQYLLIGASLSLFYLLLLSLSEQIGFRGAYLAATAMIVLLISAYSAFVLKSLRRALPILILLATLYGYLYFVLQLEDYALLFGSFLLFALLALGMYLTRNTDWFALGEGSGK